MSHRVEHISGAADVDLAVRGMNRGGVGRPGAVHDDLRAGHRPRNRGGVANVALDKSRFARPAFGLTPSQTGDVVARAEQAQDHTPTDYSAGPGDGDPHGLVVVVEERGIDQVVEIHCREVFFLVLLGVVTVGLVGQAE